MTTHKTTSEPSRSAPAPSTGSTPAEPARQATSEEGNANGRSFHARASQVALAYRPSPERTHLPEEVWEQWTEYLLPRAVAAGKDSQDVKRVRSMLSFASGLLDWCYSEHFANPALPDQVWRTTTIDRYLKHLDEQGSPQTTVNQNKWALNLLTSITPTPLADPSGGAEPTPADTSENAATTPIALLTDQPAGDVRQARISYDETYWAVLARIRERVIANHPNATATITRARSASIPLGDKEVARILFAAETLAKRGTISTAAWGYLCLGLGAGLRIFEMLAVTGRHVRTAPDGAVTVTVPQIESRAERDVPVLAPFAPVLTHLAGQTEHRSLIHGRGNGKSRGSRGHDLASAINKRDPKAVRADSGRLRATWLCVHVACGTPLGTLLPIAGLAHPESLNEIMTYVPTIQHDSHRPWIGTISTPEAAASDETTGQQQR